MGIDERRGMGENASYEWGMLLLNRESIQHNTGERGDENPPGLRSGSSIPVHQLTHALAYMHLSQTLTVYRCAMRKPDAAIDAQLHRWGYDSEKGVFYRDGKLLNKKPVCIKGKWYLHLSIANKLVRAHRLAWRLYYGNWPCNDIDHINGETLDNRIENLRDVTNAENCKNKVVKPTGKFPIGVRHYQGRYAGVVGVNGRDKSLGRRSTVREAVEDRIELLKEHGYSDRHIEATWESYYAWAAVQSVEADHG